MNTIFRKANSLDEVESVYSLFLRVKESLEESGNDMWSHDYPNKEIFLEDFKDGNLYVLIKDNKVVGSVGLTFDPLSYFFWHSRSQEKFQRFKDYLHLPNLKESIILERLMVDPSYQKQGLGIYILNEVEKLYPSLPWTFSCFMIDTPAIHFYERRGFVIHGIYPEFEWGGAEDICVLITKTQNTSLD